jgi:hypothetical protein
MNYRHLIWILIVVMATPVCADTRIMLPDPKKFADNEKNIFVQTTMPGDFQSLDAVVLALMTLSPQAANKNLTAPFFPETVAGGSSETKEPLYRYFRGLRKKGKTVTLRFSGDAMNYLNSTISMQEFIKGALEETIKLHARDCKKVEYEVDGKVVEEWDA